LKKDQRSELFPTLQKVKEESVCFKGATTDRSVEEISRKFAKKIIHQYLPRIHLLFCCFFYSDEVV